MTIRFRLISVSLRTSPRLKSGLSKMENMNLMIQCHILRQKEVQMVRGFTHMNQWTYNMDQFIESTVLKC